MKIEEFARKYFDVLHGTLKGLNLTAINDYDEFYLKQIIDSILPLQNPTHFAKILQEVDCIVDIGFGGGFPLIPLAFLNPEKKFIGFEARNKKVEAVRLIIDHFGLTNVSVHHERLENIVFDKKSMLVFKAVGTCEDMLKLIQTTDDNRPVAYFYKGPQFFEKEKEGLKKIKEMGWEIIENIFLPLEPFEGRQLFGLQKKVGAKNIQQNSKNRDKEVVFLSHFL